MVPTLLVVWLLYYPASLAKQSASVETKVSSASILNYKSVFGGDVTNLGFFRIISGYLAVVYNYSQFTAYFIV